MGAKPAGGGVTAINGTALQQPQIEVAVAPQCHNPFTAPVPVPTAAAIQVVITAAADA